MDTKRILTSATCIKAERHGDTLLCIPKSSDLRLLLLYDVNDATVAGHLGFNKPYAALRRFAF